jgi:hypothetical protein
MSEHNDMTCAELHDVAAELALGVLTGRERAAASAHLEHCKDCREDVRQLMATGERLLELLPPAEPPAGFESRVLERLGMSAPPQGQPEPAPLPTPTPTPTHEHSPRRRGSARGGARPGADQPGATRPGGDRPPTVTGTRPGEGRRPGRVRRALAATAVGLAVVAAALGGWRIGVGTSRSASSAAAPLTSASLLSATHGSVGNIFLYSGTPRWLYMYVDMGSGDESVTCQVVSANGRTSTIGSFELADGYGTWGSPDPGNIGPLTGARLVADDGTVLATATFTH